MKDFIVINKEDNVAVALKDLEAGRSFIINDREITITEDIKKGHKFSIKSIDEGENILKYGLPIGHASCSINSGQWVHVHNIKTNLAGFEEYKYNRTSKVFSNKKSNFFKFMGYKRENDEVGIRNELWIVPTVGCVNGIGENIIKEFKKRVDASSLDAVNIFKHNYGCSQLGEDHENTKIILGDIVKHPNAGGVLVLGLGCENNHMSAFKESLGNYNHNRVRFLVSQEVEDEIEEGVKLLIELFENMKKDKREPQPISELKIGLKCGGSDGFSGITANPLLGAFSDFLIKEGGTTVLTEVPEMFGAETLLMERAKDEQVFNNIVTMINNFKQYFMSYNQPVYENPSPGNKEGGISTLEEKSLGCTQKSGNYPVVDVLNYGERIRQKGLNLLTGPGNDLVASTALGAAGCHMVLFTTGRGTPFGSFVPTMKISTNNELFKLKPKWIDFNAGELLLDKSMEELLEEFVTYILKVANGELVNNEKNDFREISIFKQGVTL